jgi:SecD/SecF fusion protein
MNFNVKAFWSIIISLTLLGYCGCDLSKKPKICLEYTIKADPAELMRNMSDNSSDPFFNAAVHRADSLVALGSGSFMDELSMIYADKNAEGRLATVFALLPKYAGHINSGDPNERVVKYLDTALRMEIEHLIVVLKKRIKQCNLNADANFEADYAKATIILNLRSYEERDTDNPHLRTILTTQGKFELWNTYENEEIINGIVEADRALGRIESKERKEDKKEVSSEPSAADLLGLPDSIKMKMAKTTKPESNSDNVNPLLQIFYPRADNQQGIYPGPCIGLSFGKDTTKVNRYLAMDMVKKYFPRDIRYIWSAKPSAGNRDVYELYAIKQNLMQPGRAELGGDIIADAFEKEDKGSRTYEVTIKLKPGVAYLWERMTDNAANSSITRISGNSKPFQRCVAIVLDDKVFSAPRVRSKIKGGNTLITGIDLVEGKDLADLLRSGPIRCKLNLTVAAKSCGN